MNRKDRYFGMSPRIARWKLDTPFENWLGYKADKSEFWKKLYVIYYKIFDRKYYKGGLPFIKEEIELRRGEWGEFNESYIVRYMIYCLHRLGISFQDYCIYDLINKNYRCRNSFVTDKMRYYYCDILNDREILPLMTNKYTCYLKYQRFFKRDVLGCFSDEDFVAFEKFVTNHRDFIYKPLNEHSGHGIAKYSLDVISISSFFHEKLKQGAFVVEELITQGDEIAVVHPQSVNSFRVVTFTIDNKVYILGVTWRIGTGESIMDNAGAGGIYASIDYQLGVVESDAVDYRGKHFNIHPDTGVQIVGYKLPCWNEALLLVHDMATHLPGTTLISWDIAYSDKGWLMIEANDNGDWSIIQSIKKIGKKEILYNYMDEYFLKCK